MQNPVLPRISRDLYYTGYVGPDASPEAVARAEADKTRLVRMDRVRQTIRGSGCRQCSLWKERSGSVNPVAGEGRGRVMFVGHRQGKNEANTGRPSIGDISRPNYTMLLDAIAPDLQIPEIAARDVCLDFTYTTTHARCGSDWNTVPTQKNRKTCSNFWLSQEVRAVDPAIVVFWHRDSAKVVLGKAPPKSGVVFEGTVYGKKYPCLVMQHPAAVFSKPTYAETVRAQYGALARWLFEEGHLLERPPAMQDVSTVDHRIVTTRAELNDMVLDLLDKAVVAFDTETTYKGKYGSMTKYEVDMGALLWARDGFDVVCCQLAGLDPDENGVLDVRRTYTVAFNFLDNLGEPQQEVTPADTEAALDYLFSHQLTATHPETGQTAERTRLVVMWNAQFDCPVAARMGLDLMGLTHQDYPITILDGQLALARLNEHLSNIGAMNLGTASQMFIGESKESFDKYFKNPSMFRYMDISDATTRQRLLDYTGEDPRLTLLTTMAVMNKIGEHVQELAPVTDPTPTSLPRLGFGPFPVPGAASSASRLRDVAIPMEMQAVPLLSQMSMVGFRFNADAYREKEAYVERQNLLLRQKLRGLGYSANPNSDAETKKYVDSIITALVKGTNQMIETAVEHVAANPGPSIVDVKRALVSPLGIEAPPVENPAWRVSSAMVREAYEETFGELTAEQKTVEKFVDVYLDSVYLQLETLVPDLLPGPVRAELKARREQHVAPFVDYKSVKETLDTIFLYKKLNKIWGTYFERFKKLSDQYGVVHPQYKLIDTVSGRLSGNFQNVPRGSDELKGILDGLDVRQYIYAVQAPDLNRLFDNMRLRYRTGPKAGQAWHVKDEEYVVVTADYSAMEDRMALALTGDRTKARLLADPDLDTHFYNAAFLFGHLFADELGVDLTDEEGIMEIYRHLKEDPDKKGYKDTYRTPVKTVHYASQYGAGVNKIHNLLYPIFRKQGETWTVQQTQELVAKYNDLYDGVVSARKALLTELDTSLTVEYPIFGTLRHAENLHGTIVAGEHLSVANALNQGTCAYLAKYAMTRVRRGIQDNSARWNTVEAGGDRYVGLAIQVHDEIGVICPAELATEVAEMLEAAMKHIVGPPVEGQPTDAHGNPVAFYDTTIADAAGNTGWLYLPDKAFLEHTIMDAEAEVKRTIAKLDYLKEKVTLPDGTVKEVKKLALLPDGTPNLYEFPTLARDFPPTGIRQDIPLRLARAGASGELVY